MSLLKECGIRKGGHNDKPTRPRPKTSPPGQGVEYLYSKEIRRVNIKKDDVVVINTETAISEVGKHRMLDQIQKVFPNNKVAVLTEGATLSIIREKKD